MQVTDATIENLAHLARLRFDDTEKESVKKDLQNMIAFVEQLKEIDTTGVEPLLHMSDTVNVLREDVLQGSVSREEALKNAPLKDNEFFKVPTVIKK
jgi:aspartyl-tRNA(Asn)/glutamyl-tRNA(Gln) amidotransferase subunit C